MKITRTKLNEEKTEVMSFATEIVAKNKNQFMDRAASALGEIGITHAGSDSDLEDHFDLNPPVLGTDMLLVEDMLLRIEKRANQKLGTTDHPFTFYDFKQAIRIVTDMRAGMESAVQLGDLLESRRIPKAKVRVKVKITKKAKAASLIPELEPEAKAVTLAPKKAADKGKAKVGTVSLKPALSTVVVPKAIQEGTDRINKALDKVRAKAEAKIAKKKAKANAELATEIAAVEKALGEENERLLAADTKTKTKKTKE